MRSLLISLIPLALASYPTLQAFLQATFSLPRMQYDPVTNTVCYDYPLVNPCANAQEIEWVTGVQPPEDLTTWVPASETQCSDILDIDRMYLDWVVKEVFGEGDYKESTAVGQQQDIHWALLYIANYYHYYNLHFWSDWTSIVKDVDWSTVSCDQSDPMIMSSAKGSHTLPDAIQSDCDKGSAICTILCSFGSR